MDNNNTFISIKVYPGITVLSITLRYTIVIFIICKFERVLACTHHLLVMK
jgi:hypothetical protein